MKRGHQTDGQTLWLLDQLGPEGRVGDNHHINMVYVEGVNIALGDCFIWVPLAPRLTAIEHWGFAINRHPWVKIFE